MQILIDSTARDETSQPCACSLSFSCCYLQTFPTRRTPTSKRLQRHRYYAWLYAVPDRCRLLCPCPRLHHPVWGSMGRIPYENPVLLCKPLGLTRVWHEGSHQPNARLHRPVRLQRQRSP